MATVAHPALTQSWEFQAVLDFCRLFGPAIEIIVFPSSQLEEALVNSTSQETFLGELVCKLVHPAAGHGVDAGARSSWQDKLQQNFESRWPLVFESNPLDNSDFNSLAPETKAKVLYALCHWRMQEDASLQVSLLSKDGTKFATSHQQELVGKDSKGNQYILLSTGEECKLYKKQTFIEPEEKQNSGKEENQGDASACIENETVCSTLGELTEFIKQLSASDDSGDAAIHKQLSEALPKLMDAAAARRCQKDKIAYWETLQRRECAERQSRAYVSSEKDACTGDSKSVLLRTEEIEDKLPGAAQPSHVTSMKGSQNTEDGASQQAAPKAPPEIGIAAKSVEQAPVVDRESSKEESCPPDFDNGPSQPTAQIPPGEDFPTTTDRADPLPSKEGEPGASAEEPAVSLSQQAAVAGKPLTSNSWKPEPAEAAVIQLGAPLPLQPTAPASAVVVEVDPLEEQAALTENKTAEMQSLLQAEQQGAEGFHQTTPDERNVVAPKGDCTPTVPPASELEDAFGQPSGRPQRSSRSAVNRKYQDFDTDEEFEAAQPPAKRQATGQAAEEMRMSKNSSAATRAGLGGQQRHLVSVDFQALYPSAIDLPAPRRQRSRTPRQPRSSRASINRLKQAAHGTLPLGMKKARASLYVVAGGLSPGASGSESDADVDGEQDSSEFSDSDADSDAPRRSRKGRGRQGGASGQQQHNYQQQYQQGAKGYSHERGMLGGGLQSSALSLQQQQQLLMANANPQMRAALIQRMMQQQQQQQQAQHSGPPLFSQLPQEQQRAIASQFLQQLAPQQQQQVRLLPQDQLMHLLQNYYQSKVLAGQKQIQQQHSGGLGGMQPAPQQHPAQAPGAQAGGSMSDQQKLAVVISNLSPEARAQLQSLPPDQQRLVLAQLLQRHQLAEQQRMMQQHNMGMGMAGMKTQLGRGGPAMVSGMGQPTMMHQQPARAPGMQPQGRGRAEDAVHDVNWFLNDS